MNFRKHSRNWLLSTLTVLSVTVIELSPLLAQSSTYEIKAGDKLVISFWESPEMNAEVTVGMDGGIELSIIGRTTASGRTIDELRDQIISQMALYNKLVTQLNIKVIDYGSQRVYVTGQVRTPGPYAFEQIPNLWDIILEAGGHLETAFLDEVVIVRRMGNGQIFTVDVTEALRNGKLSELPEIYPGDTIHVPGTTATGAAPSPLVKKDEIYIMGAVGQPGSHKFQSDLNLVEVIGKAGGPLVNANLRKVRYVSNSGSTPTVLEFDLERYFHQSKPHPVQVKAGDTIFIPWKRPLSPIIRTLITAALTTTVTTGIIILLRN